MNNSKIRWTKRGQIVGALLAIAFYFLIMGIAGKMDVQTKCMELGSDRATHGACQ